MNCTALNWSGTSLDYTAMQCTALHWMSLHFTTLHWTSTVLHYTVLHYTTKYCIYLHSNALHWTELHSVLQWTQFSIDCIDPERHKGCIVYIYWHWHVWRTLSIPSDIGNIMDIPVLIVRNGNHFLECEMGLAFRLPGGLVKRSGISWQPFFKYIAINNTKVWTKLLCIIHLLRPSSYLPLSTTALHWGFLLVLSNFSQKLDYALSRA